MEGVTKATLFIKQRSPHHIKRDKHQTLRDYIQITTLQITEMSNREIQLNSENNISNLKDQNPFPADNFKR